MRSIGVAFALALVLVPSTVRAGDPQDPLADEARAAEAAGDLRGASWLWMRASELRRGVPAYVLSAGVAAKEHGDCPRAQRVLREYEGLKADDKDGKRQAAAILADIDATQCATINHDEALEAAKELYAFAEAQAEAEQWETAMYAYEDAYFLVPEKVGFAYKVGKSGFEAKRCRKAEEYLSHFNRYGDPEKHEELLRDAEAMLNRVETMGCGADSAPPPLPSKGCSLGAGGTGAWWSLALLCVCSLRRRRRQAE